MRKGLETVYAPENLRGGGRGIGRISVQHESSGLIVGRRKALIIIMIPNCGLL